MQKNIDIILNQWSIIIQISIILVLVIVFMVLRHNYPRRVAKNWLLAWQSNLLALIFIYIILMGLDKYPALFIISLYTIYSLLKILYAILLINGLSRYINNQTIATSKTLKLLPYILGVYAVIILVSQISTIHIQIITYSIIGLILIGGSLLFSKKASSKVVQLLLFVFALEGILFIHHAWALYPILWGETIPSYMTHISFLDSIIELTVGLACLLAIIYRIILEFQHSNNEMEQAQQALRQLVDEDPLTGLSNRRKLDEYIAHLDNKATLIYIDVNNFKRINDSWGHNVGDLCLQKIAHTFNQLLNNEVGKFRLGGDEFLLVIPENSSLNIKSFLNEFKVNIAKKDKTPPISVAVGIKVMNDKNDFEVAIKEADKLMYLAKSDKP